MELQHVRPQAQRGSDAAGEIVVVGIYVQSKVLAGQRGKPAQVADLKGPDHGSEVPAVITYSDFGTRLLRGSDAGQESWVGDAEQLGPKTLAPHPNPAGDAFQSR